MLGIAFEWDRRKDAANRRKHHIGFATASSVFGDPLSVTIMDPDHTLDEHRFVTIGRCVTGRLLVVVHTGRDERIRLISARPATRYERPHYEESSL